MTGVKSVFTEDELKFIQAYTALVLSDTKDYSDDELVYIYEIITDKLPYEYNSDGSPKKTGLLFESIVDKFYDYLDK